MAWVVTIWDQVERVYTRYDLIRHYRSSAGRYTYGRHEMTNGQNYWHRLTSHEFNFLTHLKDKEWINRIPLKIESINFLEINNSNSNKLRRRFQRRLSLEIISWVLRPASNTRVTILLRLRAWIDLLKT